MKKSQHALDITPETEIKIDTGKTANQNNQKISRHADRDIGKLGAVFFESNDKCQPKNGQNLHQNIEENLLGGNIREKQTARYQEYRYQRHKQAGFKNY